VSRLLSAWDPQTVICTLCGDIEDCNHIFLTCPLARFMWARARDVLHCDWNLAGAGEFLAIVEGLSGLFYRLVWFTFAAQCWALWNIRNKLIIEGKLIENLTDAIFKYLFICSTGGLWSDKRTMPWWTRRWMRSGGCTCGLGLKLHHHLAPLMTVPVSLPLWLSLSPLDPGGIIYELY
jgi:hypothetical protein